MTIKQKFSSIDQSKLTADQKAFLTKIKEVTKNFTDTEMNKKVEAPLDGFIEKAKEKMPEAIKSAPVKRTAKSKPSQTIKPKRTAMSLAKEIRKEGESWNEARARASKMMKDDSKDLSKTVETELEKLSKLVKNAKTRSKLSGISGTDIKRDSVRKAKPRGQRRVTHSGETSNQYGTFSNKLGRKYYESRDRHSDRLAPNYPKNAPLLENGGDFQAGVYKNGGRVETLTKELYRLQRELNSSRLSTYREGDNSPEEMARRNEREVKMARFNEVLKELRESDGNLAKGGAVTNERKHVNHDEDYEVRYSKPRPSRKGYKGVRAFELGGTMVTDLAGHTGGGNAGLDAGMPLSGFSNTSYSGLVGETGAMSSGEMFENGGGVPQFSQQSYVIVDSFGSPAQHYAKGGGVVNHNGREYSLGRNWTNDQRHINKSEEHEVKYNRKGKFLGIFADGGDFQAGVYADGGAIKNQYAGRTPEDIWDNLSIEQRKHFLTDHIWGNEEQIEQLKYKNLEEEDKEVIKYYSDKTWKKLSGDVKKAFSAHVKEGQYNKGGALTNERKHVNHDEDYEVRYSKPRPSRKGYKGARKFMAGGMNENSPRIYVADLEAYNSGRLVGEWLDLSDYNDADELMDAIQDVLKKSGGEEYAIHDVEYIPTSLYSEYMGARDFAELYEMMDLAKENDLPLYVVQEVVSQFGASAVEEFVGRYDSAVDFAIELVDDIGIESFTNFEQYLIVSDTDRRIIAGEEGDNAVENARYNDEFDDLSEEEQEEAEEKLRDEVYDEWYDGLNDPYYFLVEEQGLYDAESFANASFVQTDCYKLADDLDSDYTFVQHDGEVYVFNIK